MQKMMTRVRYITLGLFITLLQLQLPLQAEPSADTFQLKHLQSLFERYQRVAAYQYARRYLHEMEGDPYFDYFYGVSAIDTGHASEGVFALERVLLVFPDDPVARLELARGYFKLEEYALSREAFEEVLLTSPPSKVRDTAEAYLDKIRIHESRYRPTHTGYLALALGHDDNVNAGAEENDSLPLFIFLSPESLAQDDNYTSLSGDWRYLHPFKPGWLFESSLSGNIRINQDVDLYDTMTASLQLGITHLRGSSKFKTALISQAFELDGESYRTLNGLNLDWQYNINEQSRINTTLQYVQLDYPDFEVRNSSLTTLGASYVHSFSVYLQPVFFTSLSAGSEQADDDSDIAMSDTERDIISIRLGLILSFTNTLALQTSAGLQNSQYAGIPFTQSEKREDDYTTVDVALLWAFDRKWRLDTRFSHTENDSTFDLRDYERNVFEMSLNYSF